MTTHRFAVGFMSLAVGVIAFTMLVGQSTPPRAMSRRHENARVRGRLFEQQVAAVDHALARHDINTAVREWHGAYAIARFTPGWRPMIDVGEASVRIGEVAASRHGAKANARQAYLAALTRAERARDADGILAVADAFARLGDREVAKTCVRIAERVMTARNDAGMMERVRAYSALGRADRERER